MAKHLKACFDGFVKSEERLKMVAGVFYLPKDNPQNPQGGDANFVCKGKQTIGVADGVGRSDTGSSTVCIVSLKDHQLHAVNVGDSRFMVFRDKKLIYESPVQQHGFNCPYQLGKDFDRPNACMEIQQEVEAGDIVILATDGLFDNMYASEIEEILKEETTKGVLPEQLARTMAEMALRYSQDKERISPFAKAAQEAGKSFIGGKVDDITVVVGVIESTKA